MIKFTEIALNSIKNKLPEGVYLGLEQKGCSGQKYVLKNPADFFEYKDITYIEQNGYKIYMRNKDFLFLFGTIVDYKENSFGSEFIFENPNIVGKCGCGESVKFCEK